ncbi:hypothetical protein TNCV_2665571 [Trichonephila clavipes]|nr:hypothetical protein TNCV_2665571 [Trichonephila clavipes]
MADIRPQMLEKVIENWTSRSDYIRASRGSPMPEIIFKMLGMKGWGRNIVDLDPSRSVCSPVIQSLYLVEIVYRCRSKTLSSGSTPQWAVFPIRCSESPNMKLREIKQPTIYGPLEFPSHKRNAVPKKEINGGTIDGDTTPRRSYLHLHNCCKGTEGEGNILQFLRFHQTCHGVRKK